MHLCSLSITYACTYHNPTATMGYSIHNVDISKPLTHMTPYTLSAICPVQWKPGFIREENTSPKCQMPSNVSICSLKSVTTTNCSQVETRWGRRACRWASLRRFLTVCAEILWLCKPIVAAAVRVAGLRRSWRWRCWMWRSWYTWSAVVRLDVLPNSLKRLWRRLMVEKWTFNSRATALVDIPAVSMSIARSLKTYDICGIVLCDKTAHFRVAFYSESEWALLARYVYTYAEFVIVTEAPQCNRRTATGQDTDNKSTIYKCTKWQKTQYTLQTVNVWGLTCANLKWKK